MNGEVVSFKQRVCAAIIKGAADYKSTFLDYEYLIYSEEFTEQKYYIISALHTNFLHLTGVNTSLSTYDFFNKSFKGELTEDDFDFIKYGRDERSAKGSVRRKIKALSLMPSLLSNRLIAEESFVKNTITCSFATTDNIITVGFACDEGKDARPKTLLVGSELDKNKAVEVSLVLRREKDNAQFDTVIYGDPKQFSVNFSDLVASQVSVS